MPKILVVSLAMSDAGKTTAARSALRVLSAQGLAVTPFKPAGEFWLYRDWPDVSHALQEGRLYGHDSYLLRREVQAPFPEEVISPAFRLVVPARHDQQGQYCPTLAARCTLDAEARTHVIALDTRRAARLGVQRDFDKLIDAPGVTLHEFSTLDELNRLVARYVPQAISAAHQHIAARFEHIVYESAGFSAMPWMGLQAFDLVVAVNHGYLQLYDAADYRRSFAQTHDIAMDSNWARDHEPREHAVWRTFSLVRTAQVVEHLQPLAEAAIPPLDGALLGAGFDRAMRELFSRVEAFA